MENISRRNFLMKGTASAAAIGAMALLPALPSSASIKGSESARQPDDPTLEPELTSSSPVIVHIPDPRTGELRYMVGATEIRVTDKSLVSRIVSQAR